MPIFRALLAPLAAVSLLAATPALAGSPALVAYPAAKVKPTPPVRVDPTYWFVGMKNPKLQLLVHAPGVAASQVTLAAYPGVTLEGFQKLESANYLIVNLTVSPQTQPGQLQLQFKGKNNLLSRSATSCGPATKTRPARRASPRPILFIC